jgi:TPR repeat protein
MRIAVFGLLGLFLTSSAVAADERNDATQAYRAKHYPEAIALLTPLAEAGDIDAQLLLSNVYNFGLGVSADSATAYHWLSVAAQQGDPEALYNLGAMTLAGVGTEPNVQEGMLLLSRAAELGNAAAHFQLGMLAMQSLALTGDVDTGLMHLVQASRLGHREAPAVLATMLPEIPEVQDHLVKSALNYQVAIFRGCTDLDKAAMQAVARLSADELALYERSLPPTLAMIEAETGLAQTVGTCLPR